MPRWRKWQRNFDCTHQPSYPNTWAQRPWVRRWAQCMAIMGNPWPSLLAWVVLVSLFPRIGSWGAIAALMGLLLYKTIKKNTARLRPFEKYPHVTAYAAPPDPHSFPSGHTLNAVLMSMCVIAIFPWLAPAGLAWIVMMGVSRVVLGLHYPSDVVAGGLLGAGLGMLALFAAQRWPIML